MKYRINLNGTEHEVRLLKKDGSNLSFEVAGRSYDVSLEPIFDVPVSGHGAAPMLSSPSPLKSKAAANELPAPMPGLIVNVLVSKGETVTLGQTLLVMEAMKMENNITAPRAGKIETIFVTKGQEVNGGQPLLKFVL